MNAVIFVDSVGAPSGVLNLVIPVTLIHVVAVINVVVVFVTSDSCTGTTTLEIGISRAIY